MAVIIEEELLPEVLKRAREAFDRDPVTGVHADCACPPLTAEALQANSEEHERCGACQGLFAAGSVDEDVCPSCGKEWRMSAGIIVCLHGTSHWIGYP